MHAVYELCFNILACQAPNPRSQALHGAWEHLRTLVGGQLHQGRVRGICYYLKLGLQQIPTLLWGVGVYIDSSILEARGMPAAILYYKHVAEGGCSFAVLAA